MWAVIVDGIVFGIGHASGAEVIQLLALAAFGMGLCLLYWRTGSIIPCMALHALNNSITFGVTKDLEPALFAGVVVVSVGTVIGGGMAVSSRPSGGGRMRRSALATALLALALPAQASAQTPPPAPPDAASRTSRSASSTVGTLAGSRPAAFAGRSFTARVVMKPYVDGEGAVLRAYRGSKKILAKSLTFKAVDGGAAGVATVKVSSKVASSLAIKVSHKATPAVGTLRAKTLRVNIVRPYANTGSSGPAVRWLQGKLAALRYVVPRTGVYDAGTGRAVMAWRKVAGFSRTYVATTQVFDGLLKGKGRFKVRHPGDGRHVEARINSQVLALIEGGKVQRIYHTSSGAPATPTVRGKFRVYMKTPGINAKGMVDSSYFIRGYAIHGYASVPPYNASHGCLRVPVPNARAIYDWLRIGDVVWVEP